MHIPDNYLSPSTCAAVAAATVPVWTHSVKRIKAEIPKEKMALLGVGAAFSFVAMMFNIPMPGGTTGHAVGGTLIALLLGPESACIAITIALLIQALIFGDGGILAFGAAEVIFTVALYTYISKTSPALLDIRIPEGSVSAKQFPLYALLAILIAATPLGLIASGTAWGEWEISEIPTMTESFSWSSLLPDYSLEGLPDIFAYILSAVLGVLISITIFRFIAARMKKRNNS